MQCLCSTEDTLRNTDMKMAEMAILRPSHGFEFNEIQKQRTVLENCSPAAAASLLTSAMSLQNDSMIMLDITGTSLVRSYPSLPLDMTRFAVYHPSAALNHHLNKARALLTQHYDNPSITPHQHWRSSPGARTIVTRSTACIWRQD
jgi:hypothetical protein